MAIWRPEVETEPELNPFASHTGDQSLIRPPKMRNAEEDTAPLQGTRDLSDEDSLQDVTVEAQLKAK